MSEEVRPRMNWNASDLDREWKRFKQHCQFTFKGPLSNKSEVEKVNYLMTYIGDKGREVYATFTWAPANGDTPAEDESLAAVYAKYEEYVAPQKNEIRATVNFNRRKQEANERFEDFVTALRLLVKDCGYDNEDRMLRDAIVLHSQHTRVQEKCLEEGNGLTLARALEIGRNYELSLANMKTINEEDSSVKFVKGRKKPRCKAYEKPQSKYPKKKSSNNQSEQCPRCGYDMHPKSSCPARNEKCAKCKKKGHFARVCRRVHMVQDLEEEDETELESESESETDDETDTYHVNMVKCDKDKDEWWETVMINGHPTSAQIDTGSAQSLISYDLYKKLQCGPLKKSDRKFQSYTQHKINVYGYVHLRTAYKHNEAIVKFYVVDTKQEPLLSGEASKKLRLIERVHKVTGLENFPELKKTTGTLPGTYQLRIDPTVTPVIHGPRRQPRALIPKIKAKLNEMECEKHITKVTEPTDWVSSMVVVIKGEKIRICIDPKDLNKAIRREQYPIPTVEEVVSGMPGAKVFSVLDAKSGFLQIKLDYESSLLTTFNTPVGRYRWLRLPFGIRSAPEIYQRIMDTMLEGIPGCRAVMDDILIAAKNPVEHDEILTRVMQRAKSWNLKLNFEKCHIRKSEVKYVGHLVTAQGLKPDPAKIQALQEMPTPTTKEEVRRFLGFIQYLAKFIPNLSDVDAPLRKINNQDVTFFWEKEQENSFNTLKKICCEAPVLAYYDPAKSLTIQCDASSYALGAVLLQDGQPLAYTSRALTSTEKNYAQIEKEMLAIVHSCKKFHHYIFGRQVRVESDHKPLQSIFSKPILSAPMRLQAMMLRLQPYDLDIQYVRGKDIPVGDALSRANLPHCEVDIQPVTVNMLEHIAIAPTRYLQFQQETARELNELHLMVIKGWPDTKEEVPHIIREFWAVRDELSVYDGIVYKGMRIVVPPSMRSAMLAQIHESHLGIVKCKQRGKESLYWPGMHKHIEELVNDCPACSEVDRTPPKEPLKPTKTPSMPWEEVASDIFEWNSEHYLIVVDYFSKYIEVDKLSNMGSAATIDTLKSYFRRHGIPQKLRSDNGPQYSSSEFSEFCTKYDIEHHTSSPYHPQSNGCAERAVQTVKRLWRKGADKHLALLDYNTTPLESCDLSPAQLLMSRRPRNLIPTKKDLLKPCTYDLNTVRKQLDENKEKQKYYHDKKASAEQPVLVKGDPVTMSPLPGTNKWLPAKVIGHHHEPRSYIVEYNGKKYRRNRRDLHLSTYNAYDRATSAPYAPAPRSVSIKSHSQNPPQNAPQQAEKKAQMEVILPPKPDPPTNPPANTSPKKRNTQAETTEKPVKLPLRKERKAEAPTKVEKKLEKKEEYVTRSGRASKPPKKYEN